MLPSILSEQILQGLKSFITTGFETQTPLFKGMFSRFASQHGNLFKGPYLSIDLPFCKGTESCDYFTQFQTAFPPYLHQEQAWQRISADKDALPTLVATGTGSGKTECFLYPVIEHCARSAEKGIKAIIIYPMNALATDQAKRFAKEIHQDSKLKGNISVGLFVGGDEAERGNKRMQPDEVITDKHSLRNNPPDILLTNYKMLDFLLLRPKDQRLWQHNSAETLKYLIVDELHTFDGAQGTDLSCLIRRMKSRLQTPDGHLICVGTSATLGDEHSVAGLTDFAGKVFQTDFDHTSVIVETRQTADEFIDIADQKYQFFLSFNFDEALDWANYPDEADYILAQFQLLFPNIPVANVHDAKWRVELGKMLKQHQLFRILLRQLTQKAYPIDDLAQSFLKLFPINTRPDTAQKLLYSLCSLMAWARSEDNEKQPWVYLRIQLWLRELRRMVAPLKPQMSDDNGKMKKSLSLPYELSFYDDLKKDQSQGIYLPLVQCTQCHATAWIGVKPKEQSTLKTDLRLIYNAFFGQSSELAMLFPINTDYSPPINKQNKGLTQYLCAECGTLQSTDDHCHACGYKSLIQVYQPDFIRQRRVKNTTRLVAEHHCPMCMSQHAMMVFGARSASLASVVIHQSYASHFNDDKQLITFSDNVQDAAHRAGFFAARTWQNNLRMAIAQALPDEDSIPLTAFYQYMSAFWGKAMDDKQYISEFIAPNMLYYPDYVALIEEGALPKDSNLIANINNRLEWEVLAEFGYRGAVGRSLQRTGTANMGIERDPIQQSVKKLYEVLREELGLRQLNKQSVANFVTGFLLYLKRRGAIYHRFLDGYIQNDGKNFLLTKKRYLPPFAPHTPAPIFVCNRNSHPKFDCLINKKGFSWYQQWCRKTLLAGDALEITGNHIEASIFQRVLPVLVQCGLLLECETSKYKVWGLNPDVLYLSKQLTRLETQQQHDFSVPEAMAELVEGMPSLILNDRDTLSIVTSPASNWLRQLYNHGIIKRVIAHEHTGLLDRKRREAIENDFMQGDAPWSLNLLSATPTLEMGIDIGDLSSVLLCSVPPGQANYLQRIGRAGRRDGNAFNLTVAQGAPHDLHFYANPREMMVGTIESPNVYLNATAVMSRQLIAFCMDNWVATGINETALPLRMSQVLNNVERKDMHTFPYTLIAYVHQHADELLAKFLNLFTNQLNDFSQRYLTDYLLLSRNTQRNKGVAKKGLEHDLILFLSHLVEERNSLKKNISQLRRHLRKLEKLPKDEAVQHEIDEVQIERDGLSAILRKINGKQVLNFFTDEGLLPNYAFPESGVTLRSVIFRKRKNPKEGESAFENDVFEYERAGSSAISELAPENTFYAGGRKVKIQQIDLKLSPFERWRFCPSCHYSKQDIGEHLTACPRCHDPMWADAGQSVQMVRMRQVMANTRDKDSRIGDDSDDREPVFYSKQLLPDFEPKNTKSAYSIKSEAFPFGFEFISKVDFREINFGQYSAPSEETSIAGELLSRPGFTICKYCGMVQDKSTEQNHAFACSYRKKPAEDSIIDCLYLYREFSSEALRILLPVHSVEGTDRYLNSFIAGLQLGLKRKFGGKVDHLRAMSYSAPIPDTTMRQHFLMIYDSVPGGTGYLQDLMSKPDNLLDVFRQARDVMAGCECHHTNNDGCYHCLYAYRNSHGMESTSRDLAIALFSTILDLADKIESVDRIEEVQIHPAMDSELEVRFIEAIRRFGRHRSIDLTIYPHVVRGKAGYFLQIGQQEYLIELQVLKGETDGVQIHSKPDFLISAARTDTAFLPIAIFMDGFAYHQHSVTEDTLKRLALVESGRYYQWSLTWADVNEQFAKSQLISRNPFNENRNEILGEQKKQLFDAFGITHLQNQIMQSPFEQLMHFLQQPEPKQWQKMVFVQSLGWFDSNMTSPDFIDKVTKSYKTHAPSALNEAFADLPEKALYGGLGIDQPADPLTIVCKVPMPAIQQLNPELANLTVLLDNSADARQRNTFKAAWHGFLRLYNLFQFLPASGFFTAEGGKSGVYESLIWRTSIKTSEVNTENLGTSDKNLKGVLEEALEEFHQPIRAMASKRLPLPAVLYELQNDIGEIIAEAEFYWEEMRIVGLLGQQMKTAPLFRQAGWQILELDDRGEWLTMFEEMMSEEVV